ncbi:efflux RND transporter periplasmic adaptor subunit [Tissierella creatinini]|nr:efflux RND transporter periplasmic adaptor subunit [Tissierella creatinini]TJX63547.1 efflux RND transporter periplasmic adaptor subunit [Soehngenia saccharolytica]
MKKKIIVFIVAALLIGAGAYYFYISQNKGIEVNVKAVERGRITSYVEEIGEVKVKDYVNIYSPTSGKVTDVKYDVGDVVKKGDVLIRLDGEDISKMIKELDAQRSIIVAQLNEAKEPVDAKSIEKLNIEIKNIEKRIEFAEKDVSDSQMLYSIGASSAQEVEAARRNLDFEMSNLDKAKLDLELMMKPVSANRLAQYKAQLNQIDVQKKNLRDSTKDFTVTSTIEGTVLLKDVEVGSYLQPGMHIMEIGNINNIYVESEILVGDIGKISEGSEVLISSDDLDLKGLKGKVSKIHPTAFSKISDLGIEQKRIKVEIILENANPNLRPGYDLDIKIILEKNDDTLLIPENAVFGMDGKNYVFTVEESKAILREVKTGIESERQIEILAGLEEGEIVILSPDNDLEDGIKVEAGAL